MLNSRRSFPNATITGVITAEDSLDRGDTGDLAADIGDVGGLMNLVEEDGLAVMGLPIRA